MLNPSQFKTTLRLSIIFFFLFAGNSFANDLTITNVTLGARSPSDDTLVVNFDVSWKNSWRTKINHDAIWLTIRLNNPAVVPTDKKLCQINASGLNPSGSSTGSNSNLEIYVPQDSSGAFLRPASFGLYSSVSSTSVQFTIDYGSCGFSDSDSVVASVFGLETVYIPEGAFYAGDFDMSNASLDEGSADSDPWSIQSESSMSVANPASNGYRYVSNSNAGEDPTGATFTIPAAFPKGYAAFYAMKYPITEGQWVEFVNSLPSAAARANRDLTNSLHKNTDTVQSRNTLSCSGSPLTCSTQRPYRALNYLSWMDLAAFLDWASLRPMTELEFEKMSRGALLPVPGEFVWGSTSITAASAISGSDEDGTETITTTDANAHFDNTVLTGGDTSNGAEYQQGPLRVGIFATDSSSRISAGAGYYGVMDLSGNVRERAVTIGNSIGRSFAGTHGDGVLVTATGYEGNATNTDWPGIDGVSTRGVTGATGAGFKGGGWADQSSGARLRISDRYDAAKDSGVAFNDAGGRGVRTYDGN